MKKITNISKDDLLFPRLDLHLSSGETKIVTDEVFNQLSGNPSIKEIIPEVIPEIKEMETIKDKGEIKAEIKKVNKK